MRNSRRWFPIPDVSVLLAAAFAGALPAARGSAAATGVFSQQADVGAVSRPGTAAFAAATGTYTLGASGANIWGTVDAFGFVWKQVSGDLALAADIAFVGTGGQVNRKACLMFRQSLDPASPYVDVAVHGDGHTALQFRGEAGGSTTTIQCPGAAPRRVRLEKRGRCITLSIAGANGELAPSGCAVRLELAGPFYVGLAVCAHDNAAFETATFSAVELGAPPAATRTFALETLAVDMPDHRRVVYRADTKLESPHFSPDGAALFFNRDGRIQRIAVSGAEPPAPIDTSSAVRCNNDHGISPDGTQLVVSDLTETGRSLMYLLPIGGGRPTRVDVAGPAYWHGWSPDGGALAYCAERLGNYDIYTVPVSGGAETRLTTAPGNDNGPDYSPDGRWVYFHSERSGRMQIWRMHTDGSNQEPVTDDDFFNWFPHPSPDGRWIAILSSKVAPDTGHPPDGDYVLRLLPAAGGGPRELARFHGGNGSFNVPCWSRDSARLAFASYTPAP